MGEHHLGELDVRKRAGEEVRHPDELRVFPPTVHSGRCEHDLRSPEIDDPALPSSHDLEQQPCEVKRHSVMPIEHGVPVTDPADAYR